MLRQAPVSPVRVSVQTAAWTPQPSNANIESGRPSTHPPAPPEPRSSTTASLQQFPASATSTGPMTAPGAGAWREVPINAGDQQPPVLDVFREEDMADLELLAGIGSMDLGLRRGTGTQGSSANSHAELDFGFSSSASIPTRPAVPAVPAVGGGPTLSPALLPVPSTERPLPATRQEDTKPSELRQAQEGARHSRDTDTSGSLNRQLNSTESSVTTSASSLSGINETPDAQVLSLEASPESSIIEDGVVLPRSIPALQYHHQSFMAPGSSIANQVSKPQSSPELMEADGAIKRHLTPTIYFDRRRSSLPRPQSSYSAYSDIARGRSPGLFPGSPGNRVPSAGSGPRKSPDPRLSTYSDLLNVPYPQPAPAPLSIDNSQLRNAVGTNASLLSAQKTLDMYRQNVKKTNDFSIQYSFAVFLIATAQEQGLSFDESTRKKTAPKPVRDHDSPYIESAASSPLDLVREARAILQKLSNSGYPFAQYYLADGFASGLFSKGKEDYNSAFPLFVLAAKHGHAESAYRTALCYEFGWGCRSDPTKAVQFLRIAASKRHPGAMTRLGRACLSGDLGEKRYREGVKWLKLATESADTMYNAAPYHLGCLYETGYGDDVFKDESYAAELFTQAAELGHAEANYRMGDAYEHGRLNCPRDISLSIHFYVQGAEAGHPGAMMGLCAWYMLGAEPMLEKDEVEAYEWAKRAAELGK
jgi:TPR repeat protein